MVHHRHKLESTNLVKSDDQSSSNAQREVEEIGRTSQWQKRNAKLEKPGSDLPSLTIIDSSKPKECSFEVINSKGNRVLRLESGAGQTSEIEYNDQNQPIRYRDFSNEEYVNTEPGNQDSIWKSTSNRVQKDGVKISFDENTKSSTLVDVYTKNVVTTSSEGLETTTYAPSNGQTIRKMHGSEEWITTHDSTGKMREMYIVDNKLQRYTDDRGFTYTLSGKSPIAKTKADSADPTTIYTPTYKAVGPDGQEVAGTFTISANRTGNVMVRDENRPGDMDCCRRTRVDGAIVTSTGDGGKRLFRALNGVEVETTTIDKTDSVATIQQVIRNPDRSSVEAVLVNGAATIIKQIDASGQTTNDFHQTIISDGILVWEDQNGVCVSDPSELAATNSIEDGPTSIQKTPKNENDEKGANLTTTIADCQTRRIGWSTLGNWHDNGNWLYKNVNYGGIWDFKAPASRTKDENNNVSITQDQLGKPEYEDYANWYAGVMGYEMGIPNKIMQEEAGAAQVKHGTSRPEWGQPGLGWKGFRVPLTGSKTYGDDPHDNELIQQGYSDAPQVEEELKNAA